MVSEFLILTLLISLRLTYPKGGFLSWPAKSSWGSVQGTSTTEGRPQLWKNGVSTVVVSSPDLGWKPVECSHARFCLFYLKFDLCGNLRRFPLKGRKIYGSISYQGTWQEAPITEQEKVHVTEEPKHLTIINCFISCFKNISLRISKRKRLGLPSWDCLEPGRWGFHKLNYH